jgi:two-component system, chemotaxis family, protein-glutamate methylesterase/glutaminase
VRRIRVLVVDDSVVMRRMFSEILSSDPTLDVVGTASSGSIALAKIPQLSPDLVTLDVGMPEMSGLEVLAEIRKTHGALPVIMVSCPTERDADSTLQALSAGASDYATKPAPGSKLDDAIQHMREQLLPKIRALCANEAPAPVRRGRGSLPPPAARATTPGQVGILAIGASTGGPNALTTLFSQLPGSLPVPVVIVQHMPPLFTKLLADRLSTSCSLQFHEAKDGDLLRPGQAWIAPGDHHMRIVRDGASARVVLDQSPPENSCRPAVDVLFRSVAAAFGAAALAVVLTGMGQDGLRGCEHVHERGGQILVQDESSSVVWGMPGFVARAGLAQAVLPLEEIAGEIRRRMARLLGTSSGSRVA